jgi:DNA-binding XRE family transcriptional regulator
MAFKEMRIRAKLTQEEAAEKFGVDQSTIHAWETGKWAPRVVLLCKIAAVYGCTVDELLKEAEK